MSWSIVDLNSICRPRQWKTLSMDKLTDVGYPVYGANGKIGFYSEYTHEQPTLAITCRGATCGNVHITDPKSYINGNAMALDNLSKNIDLRFLYYYFIHRGFSDVISGSAQPQITGEGLSKIQIPLPLLQVQKRIAEILDAADALRKKDQELLKKYDELAQAIFIDMFGDPVKNEKGWEENQIKSIASKEKHSIKAGPFGSSLKKEFYRPTGYKIYGQEQVIADDLSIGDYYIDEAKYLELKNCAVDEGDVLISLVGTYGKISVVPKIFEKGIINPRLMKISLDEKIYNPYFFKFLMQTNQMYDRVSKYSRGGTMDIVNLGIISDVLVITPPLKLQEKFLEIFNTIKKQKDVIVKHHLSSSLFDSTIKLAFSGELVS